MNVVRRACGLMLMTAVALLVFGLTQAQTPKPLSEADLLKLVELQLEDPVIVARLEKAGISFTVDGDVLERLKKAGASPAILTAVRKAAEAKRPAPEKAVTYQDVLKLLELGIEEKQILERLAKSPTVFTLDARQVDELKKAGASDKLLAALQGKRAAPGQAGDVTDFAIILDCSGSMVDKTKEGPTKMEVAKKVVIEMIQKIPDGRRVTFLVYGHDREQKCQAVKVVRPLSELDAAGKAELTRYIAGLQPTGHTPIALALQTAGQELAKNNAYCGLILITDGMETCHGDPAEEAAALAKNPNLTFGLHIVGFDVNPMERKAVEAIAQAGKGQFYDAHSTSKLKEFVAVLRKGIDEGKAPEQLENRAEGFKAGRLQGHTAEVASVAFTPDGRRVVSASEDRTVRLWDVATGKEADGTRVQVRTIGGASEDFVLAPDGRRFIYRRLSHVHLGDVANKRDLKSLQAATHLSHKAFSRNGRRVAIGTMATHGDVSVLVWDLETDKRFRFEGHPKLERIRCVALSSDGQLGLSAAKDGVRLWEVETGKQRWHLDRPTVTCLAFSPDGRLVLTGSMLGTFQAWDVETGKEVGSFEGHDNVVTCAVFSADGRRILSGSADKTVRLWDVETRKELHRFEGHTGEVTCVALSADGRRATSGGKDQMVWLWDVTQPPVGVTTPALRTPALRFVHLQVAAPQIQLPPMKEVFVVRQGITIPIFLTRDVLATATTYGQQLWLPAGKEVNVFWKPKEGQAVLMVKDLAIKDKELVLKPEEHLGLIRVQSKELLKAKQIFVTHPGVGQEEILVSTSIVQSSKQIGKDLVVPAGTYNVLFVPADGRKRVLLAEKLEVQAGKVTVIE